MPFSAITYPTAVAFLQRTQPFLERNESLNNLILGVSIRLVEHPDWEEFPFSLTTIEDQSGDIHVASVMTPPKHIALAGLESPSLEAVETLVASLVANQWQPPGVTGPKELSEMFARVWTQTNGQVSRSTMNQRVYELRHVIQVPDCPGHLRPATESDLETVAAWRSAFLAEAIEPEPLESSRKIAARRIAAGDTFLWDDGGPVSMATRSRPTRNGFSIGGVYTPPEKRRKGYASACVAALSQLILDSGKCFCNLFTDLANPTSNDIYMKIGYVPLGDFKVYRFEAPES